mgnify:FL=1|tara:strand:+ start:863 stop:1582 length:720 start_codon:yes stop_codon:yes gene_type:complete
METTRDAIKSVKVYSLDEEKLKYKVIIAIDGDPLHCTPGEGAYNLNLPPLTSFGNSNHYNQCIIKLDSCVLSAVDAGTNDQVWNTTNTAGAAQRVKCPAIEVRINAPSSQTLQTGQVRPEFRGVGDSHQGNFREFVPLELKLCGSGEGALILGQSAVIPGPPATIPFGMNNMANYAWYGNPQSDGIMCGNPFGSSVVLQNRYPPTDNLAYIGSNGAGAGSADAGMYQYQFTITMVPNRD